MSQLLSRIGPLADRQPSAPPAEAREDGRAYVTPAATALAKSLRLELPQMPLSQGRIRVALADIRDLSDGPHEMVSIPDFVEPSAAPSRNSTDQAAALATQSWTVLAVELLFGGQRDRTRCLSELVLGIVTAHRQLGLLEVSTVDVVTYATAGERHVRLETAGDLSQDGIERRLASDGIATPGRPASLAIYDMTGLGVEQVRGRLGRAKHEYAIGTPRLEFRRIEVDGMGALAEFLVVDLALSFDGTLSSPVEGAQCLGRIKARLEHSLGTQP